MQSDYAVKIILPQLAEREGLADHRQVFAANGCDWRTLPLWGIGLVGTVNDHDNFLHDARAV
jgi:CxxC motif-containing protein (DUF1111 family)